MWDSKNYEEALEKACFEIFDLTGGCPLDKGECQFPSLCKSNLCDGAKAAVHCWTHYFLGLVS